MKRLVSVLLSATLLMGVAALPATAAEKTYALGDVNMDGRVDTKDAMVALDDFVERLAIPHEVLSNEHSLLSEMQLMLADVNKDGCADGKDASRILQYYILHDLARLTTLTMDEFIAGTNNGSGEYNVLLKDTLAQYTVVTVDDSGTPVYELIAK